MIDRQLALLEAEPPARLRWLVPALVAAAAASGALLFASVGEPLFAGLFLAGVVAMLVAAFVLDKREGEIRVEAPAGTVPDFALASSTLNLTRDPAALTDAEGRLLGTNAAYRSRYGDHAPASLAGSAKAREAAKSLSSQAWREGRASGEIAFKTGRLPVSVERVGTASEILLWRIARGQPDMLATLVKRVSGLEGQLFAASGVLAAAVDDDGRVLAANAAFVERVGGDRASVVGRHFGEIAEMRDNALRLSAEGENALPLRLVHVPVDGDRGEGAGLMLLVDTIEHAQPDSSNMLALLTFSRLVSHSSIAMGDS